MKQNKEHLARRKQYTSQFYRGNHVSFIIASLSSLLIGALNLGIAWVMQQMIDTVSGVPGALSLPVLAWLTLGIIGLIVIFKTMAYISLPKFL